MTRSRQASCAVTGVLLILTLEFQQTHRGEIR